MTHTTPDGTAGAAGDGAQDTGFLGHPKGLAVLFVAEMWERFSYYGMRALLVTYLIFHFVRSENHAYGVYAAYAGMIYLAPVLGGYLGDKYLGARKAVAFGAVLITFGHFAMAFEGDPGREILLTPAGEEYAIEFVKNPEGDTPQFVRQIAYAGNPLMVERLAAATGGENLREVTFRDAAGETVILRGELERVRDGVGENMMFLALALIIVGTGFLKANISAIVGALYGERDPRRDSGFTIFYFGINVGALAGIGLVGWLGIAYGWAYGFGLAGIGMLLGLIVFLIGQPWLRGHAEPPDPVALRAPVFAGLNREWLIYLGGIAAVLLAFVTVKYLGQTGPSDLLAALGLPPGALPWIQDFTLFDLVVSAVFLALFVGVFLFAVARLERVDRDRMVALLVLTLSSVVFWTLFDQAPTSLVVFQSKFVDTMGLTAQQIGMFNPIFILLMAPFFTYAWQTLGKRGRDPSTPLKFSLGLAQIGLGFLVLYAGIQAEGDTLTIGLIWVVAMYFLHTTGELMLSPVGLSAVTKLSVKRLVGFMLGMWFMAVALAQVAASLVSKATTVPEGAAPAAALAQFGTVYLWLGLASILAALAMGVAAPLLARMQHGRD